MLGFVQKMWNHFFVSVFPLIFFSFLHIFNSSRHCFKIGYKIKCKDLFVLMCVVLNLDDDSTTFYIWVFINLGLHRKRYYAREHSCIINHHYRRNNLYYNTTVTQILSGFQFNSNYKFFSSFNVQAISKMYV